MYGNSKLLPNLPNVPTVRKRGEKMKRSKYKILPSGKEFRVWKLKNVGNGYAWEDEPYKFSTKEKAEQYIESEEKRGDNNDEC